jgi:hypothetical protein
MLTVAEVRLVLVVFLVWACAVGTIATRSTTPRWMTGLVLLPLALLLRTNPFGSPLTALVFFLFVSVLSVVLGLSLPLGLWFGGQLGATSAIISAVLLAVPSFLKGAAPGRRWIGVTLAALFGPWGQWYLDDGGRWVTAVSAFALALGFVSQLLSTRGATNPTLMPEFPKIWLGWWGLGFRMASALLIYVRFLPAQGTSDSSVA